MVAPRFYIFGVPDGFDMLGGTRQEISYFQRFYDGSTEDTKFTSHRDSNGNVTYTFLKYNLSSCKSRTGSFFGMSLAFSGVYCNHPLRLYELFDYVYQNHIICNTSDASKGFLKPITNSDIKAQYLITRFEDCKEHIKFVEKVFHHNLATDDMLTTSFYPLDPAFKNENQNLVVKLPLVVEFEDEEQRKQYRERFEESLIGRFREYSYVTISPDWKPKVIDNTKEPDSDVEIAPQKIVQWKDLIPDYQRYIIQGLGNLATTVLDEVKRYQKQTEEILGQLKKYSYNKNIAPSIQANYEELCNQLADLYQKAADAQSGGGGGTNPPPDPIPPNPTPTPSFWDNVKEWVTKNKGKVAIIASAVVLVVLLVLIRPKGEEPYQNEPSYCELVADSIQTELDASSFDKAKTIAERIPDSLCRDEKLSLVIKEQAVALDKEISRLIIGKSWKEAFDKTGQYFDEDAKRTKKAEIQTVCVDDFITKIGKLNGNNYTSNSKQLIRDLDNVKDYIGDNYNSLKKNIEDKKPKVNPPINTPQYVVEIYTADRLYHPSSLYETIRSTQNIKVTSSDNYIIKIKKGDKYLTGSELSNAISIPSESTQSFNFTDKQQGCVRMFLQAQSVTFTVNKNIVITIEK